MSSNSTYKSLQELNATIQAVNQERLRQLLQDDPHFAAESGCSIPDEARRLLVELFTAVMTEYDENYIQLAGYTDNLEAMLTPEQVREVMFNTATDVPAGGVPLATHQNESVTNHE